MLRRLAALALTTGFALASAAASGRAAAEGLRAGAAVIDLAAPLRAPLGGYGGVSDRLAEGVLDPPQARALVIEDGDRRLAIVSLDVVIVRPGVRAELLARTQDLDLDALLLVATHTHSGPGAYVEGWLGERVTAGTYDPAAPGRLAAAAARAVEQATMTLAPARAGAAIGTLDLARNRRRAGGPRETQLPVLELSSPNGERIARLFAYGVHAVALGPSSHLYSGDLVGAARATLDRDGGTSIFLPGPLGDQNPMFEHYAPWPDDLAAQRENARAWGARLADAVRAVQPEAQGDARLEAHEVWANALPLALPRGSLLWWLSPLAAGQIDAFLSKRAPFQALRIGNACFLALPAEPSSELGDAARGLVPAGCTAFVIAHANDWLGYALTAEDFARGGYEAGLSVFGAGFGGWLIERAAEVARQLSMPSEATVTP